MGVSSMRTSKMLHLSPNLLLHFPGLLEAAEPLGLALQNADQHLVLAYTTLWIAGVAI
jgi:hypothetical protein